MKILIYDHETHKRIRLWFPLSFIKSSLIINIINSRTEVEPPIDKEKLRVIVKKAYPILKAYKKQYRHFALVDIVTHEHDIVKITL